jgi:hypothetical protein
VSGRGLFLVGPAARRVPLCCATGSCRLRRWPQRRQRGSRGGGATTMSNGCQTSDRASRALAGPIGRKRPRARTRCWRLGGAVRHPREGPPRKPNGGDDGESVGEAEVHQAPACPSVCPSWLESPTVSAWIGRAVEPELERQGRGNVSNHLSSEP